MLHASTGGDVNNTVLDREEEEYAGAVTGPRFATVKDFPDSPCIMKIHGNVLRGRNYILIIVVISAIHAESVDGHDGHFKWDSSVVVAGYRDWMV